MAKVIEFYQHPKPRRVFEGPAREEFTSQLAEEELEIRPASEVLKEVLDRAETVNDVLVLMRDADGNLGFVTNLADMVETIHFMRVNEFAMLQHEVNKSKSNGPKGTA